MEGFKVKVISAVVEKKENDEVSGEPYYEETDVEFESEVYKIITRIVKDEIKTDFLVYHEKYGFLWVTFEDCDIVKERKQTPKRKSEN